MQELESLRRTHVGLAGTRLRIVERSAIPDEERKDSPSLMLNLAVGIVGGAMLAFVLPFFLEYWRDDSEREVLRQVISTATAREATEGTTPQE